LKLIQYFYKKDSTEINYLPKTNIQFNHHHYLKDIDILFYPSGPMVYVVHESSKDLLEKLLFTDYHKFNGTVISIEGEELELGNLKFPLTEWFDVCLFCDVLAAERFIRFLDINEALFELNRQSNVL
jgi:hypothetical protein